MDVSEKEKTTWTTRDRLQAIFSGELPDRIPWIPRLSIWYHAHRNLGTLPEVCQGMTLREIEKMLGAGRPARGQPRLRSQANVPALVGNPIFRVEFHDMEVVKTDDGLETLTEYITPLGTVSTRFRRSAELDKVGIGGLEVEHLLKGPGDYPIVEYLIEHTDIVPTYEDYIAYEEEVGEDGIPMIYIGQDPMSRFLMEIAGYNNAYFHLHDYPELVAHLLEVLNEQARLIWEVTARSPATLILHGQHFDSQMTPPPIFEQYMVPYYQEFHQVMHAHGKVVTCHADADTKALLDLIKAAGFDMAECFVSAPMASVTVAEARAKWGTDLIIWGGIPSIMLCEPVTDEEFEQYMLNLFQTISPGEAFILGVADNVMPETKFARLLRVKELVEEMGSIPIHTNQGS